MVVPNHGGQQQSAMHNKGMFFLFAFDFFSFLSASFTILCGKNSFSIVGYIK